MNRTVSYQETPNDFSDVRQTIKNTQIATIKQFGANPPSGTGDFMGQLGMSHTAAGETLLYVSSVGGWVLIGASDALQLPDAVVMEDRENNFTNVNQRIEDCPIVYVDEGTRDPNNVPIKGPGHTYVLQTTPPEVYFSPDGASWIRIRTKEDDSDYVEINKANDFTNTRQTIDSRPIVSVVRNALDPVASGVAPSRDGELYIQLKEGTTDGRARMWVSNPDGGLHWEALSHIDLPATVAMTSKSNNFQPVDQKIAGKQILSYVDGGDLTPEQSKLPADYDGQFYMAVHTKAGGAKSVGVWVADGNQWLPIVEDVDSGTIVRTDKSNVFSNPYQYIGSGLDAKWIPGARTKSGALSPVADANWKATLEGEMTIYVNATVNPTVYSLWVAMSVNPNPSSNTGEWAMIWSSKHGPVEDYAKLDKSNVFAPMQYITDGSKNHLITVAREGGATPPKGRIVPMSSGEQYTQSFTTPGVGETRHLWMSALEGDTESWVRLHTASDEEVIRNNQVNHFQHRDQFLGVETNTKRNRIMGSRWNNAEGTVYNGVAPTMFGEVVVCEEWDPTDPSNVDKKVIVGYLAVGTGRKSWIEIGRRLKKDLELLGDDSND